MASRSMRRAPVHPKAKQTGRKRRRRDQQVEEDEEDEEEAHAEEGPTVAAVPIVPAPDAAAFAPVAAAPIAPAPADADPWA